MPPPRTSLQIARGGPGSQEGEDQRRSAPDRGRRERVRAQKDRCGEKNGCGYKAGPPKATPDGPGGRARTCPQEYGEDGDRGNEHVAGCPDGRHVTAS